MVQTPDITPGRKETETERGWGREARQHRKSKITNDAAAHEETRDKDRDREQRRTSSWSRNCLFHPANIQGKNHCVRARAPRRLTRRRWKSVTKTTIETLPNFINITLKVKCIFIPAILVSPLLHPLRRRPYVQAFVVKAAAHDDVRIRL